MRQSLAKMVCRLAIVDFVSFNAISMYNDANFDGKELINFARFS